MGLIKYRLGELIELVTRKNVDLVYGVDDVRGVSNTKGMIPTKADMSTRELDKFYIIKPGEFVFNRRTTRNGERLGMAYNDTNRAYIFTSDYVAFRIKDVYRDKLLDDYLYMFFCRDEFDRYVRVNSWGSATEFFNWDNMCDVVIKLSDFDIQSKYVSVYRSMLKNQQSYDRGIDDLKLVIDGKLDDLKKTAQYSRVGNVLEEIDERNSLDEYNEVMGINITKQFMPSNFIGKDLKKYKIVHVNDFAYSSMQTGRDNCIRIALLNSDNPVVVSPAYSVLRVKNDEVLPEYIMMWFSRAETDRYGAFLSDGSVRANLDLMRFYDIQIPVPSMIEQQALVTLYHAYQKRIEISERLKEELKNICPVLIRGAMEEAGA